MSFYSTTSAEFERKWQIATKYDVIKRVAIITEPGTSEEQQDDEEWSEDDNDSILATPISSNSSQTQV